MTDELDRLRTIRSNQPFLEWLGIEVEDAGPGWVRERLVLRPSFLQPDVVHGGVIYALADTCTAHAVLTRVHPAEWCTTVTQNISFMKPVVSGTLICNAKVVRLGRRLAFSDAEVLNDSGEIVATSSATLMRLPMISQPRTV